MIELDDLRNAVLAWAAENGILAESAEDDPGVIEGDSSILPFEPKHAEYFRTRKIVRVVGEENVLGVNSRLKVAKEKIKELENLFEARFKTTGIRLEIGISKPFRVDQSLQIYGRFMPIHRVSADRIACGSSVGLGNQRNAGTLTALARHKEDGRLCGLSCNHVVGGCSTARLGVPIVVPGIQDVSATHDEINVIGYHLAAAPMSQGLPAVTDITHNYDLACFELREPNLMSSMQGSGDGAYDTPTTFAQVRRDLTVKKWGRSTQLTKGRVRDVITGGFPVDYKVTSYYGPMYQQVFKGTVYFNRVFEVEPRGGPFSLGGDSGALVVTDTDGPESVAGILIAGGKDKSLVLPLLPMLETLGLELVGGHHAD